MVDLERIIELEKEDRLRPRLRDRHFTDWIYFARHPLHQHDVELVAYYFNIGLCIYAFKSCVQYFLWVKDEFVAAKKRDDVVILKRLDLSRTSAAPPHSKQFSTASLSYVRSSLNGKHFVRTQMSSKLMQLRRTLLRVIK
jgi:hypothetical protein